MDDIMALFLRLSSLLTIISLMGCQTSKIKTCSSLNWRGAGQNAALKGLDRASSFSKLKDQCEKFKTPIENTSFDEGYLRGLAQFCTTASGFDYGFAGNQNPQVCPKSKNSIFLKGFYKGRLENLSSSLKKLEKLHGEAQDRVWRKEQDYALLQNQDPEQAKLEIETLEAYRSETLSLEDKKRATKKELLKTKKIYAESFF